MRIRHILWPDDRIEHIARHAVTPEEFEEVCFANSLVQNAKAEGGRYLFCVVIAFPDGNGFPITARPMTEKEGRRYRQWRNR